MAADISFVCRAKAHERPAARGVLTNPVTYHEGSWAYCASGAPAGHLWEKVDATALDEIRQRLTREDRRHAPERN